MNLAPRHTVYTETDLPGDITELGPDCDICDCLVCGCSVESSEGRERSAGMLGHVTREQALVCLQNCPLLTDMADWSHWDVVFRPALRDLKDFIQKHGGVYQCTTLGRHQQCLSIRC